MKTKLATITIWQTDENRGESSLSRFDHETKEGRVILRPVADRTMTAALDPYSSILSETDRDHMESVLAHELGHVVAQIFNDLENAVYEVGGAKKGTPIWNQYIQPCSGPACEMLTDAIVYEQAIENEERYKRGLD